MPERPEATGCCPNISAELLSTICPPVRVYLHFRLLVIIMAVKRNARKGKVSRSAGRFGVRYGRKDRKLVADLEIRTKAPHTCAKCDQPTVRRIGTGIWECRKCGYKFAGGTFLPETSVGQAFRNSMKNALQDSSKKYYYAFLDEEEEVADEE